ncbi:MAG: DNA polymerase II large subunit [Thermoproteota archaeon]|nr:DNA polymerase II large subunit [Thermoproteota archaeon]
MSKEHKQYTTTLEKKLKEIYEIARKAREKGLDPALEPESGTAKDLAELVEGLVGPPGVAKSIRELSGKLSREELAFKITEEIVYGKFGHMEPTKAAEQAVRTALATLTEGVPAAAPLEGIAKVAIKKNPDRTKYLAVYFAGPIRSAGGTDQALTLVIADFVRRLLGLDRYKPTEEEIKRFVEEVRVFERSVSRFQYHVSDQELRNAFESIPVEVTGVQSNPVEVSSFRNLPRVETNRVRGGALRVVNDGIIGRSAKVWTVVEKLGIEGWDWLKKMREIEEKKSASFMQDIIAGRPIFSFPSAQGGFRLRYGRARNTGLAAVGIHPASMLVLQRFPAAGTQFRLELPGKGGVVLPVDSIEPPIVRLRNGSVVRVSLENFEQIKNVISKILFLGDLLVSFGDFLYNNRPLAPSGYTEEWWREDLLLSIAQNFDGNSKGAADAANVSVDRLKSFLDDPFHNKPTGEEAIRMAVKLQVPLHPFFTFFWRQLSCDDFQKLRRWLLTADVQTRGDVVCDITGGQNALIKGLLEKICIPHRVVRDKIKIEDGDAYVFAFCLGLQVPELELPTADSVLEVIRKLTGVVVKEKAPTFVGARMGRPEKAKRRAMRPLVHVLFPVGLAGGSRRNLVKASEKKVIEVEVVKRRCPRCGASTFNMKCPVCGVETVLAVRCPRCGKILKRNVCPNCGITVKSYEKQLIDLKGLVDGACEKLGVRVPELVKGVKGLMNETKTPELLEKGILRAKYDLSVFKDGTVRFDATNAPLTHFKPEETGVSVEKIRELGYAYDYKGEPLTRSDQVCELKVQDVIVSLRCAKYFVRVAAFLDELLEKVYGLPPYYHVKQTSDLVGRFVVGLAPHTSVGVVGRIIGFTNSRVCYAHPLWHSAKRRDCDGDEDSLMLALDTMLNFSKVYLPARIGGIMDAPLLVLPVVNPQEVQRQAHQLDVAERYPLGFYEKTWEKVEPKYVTELIELVEHRLGKETQFQGFHYTTPVSNINEGNSGSTYKKLRSMLGKLKSQLELAEKIEAVDAKQVALKVLTTHFIRDIAGNLRAFSTQSFRCKSCNRKFRRIPLQGKCPSCGGKLTLTVYRGGIKKYLKAAQRLVEKYGLPKYYKWRLSLVEDELHSLFEGGKPRQISLSDFV